MHDLIIQLTSNVPAMAKEGHTSSLISDSSDKACILVDDNRRPSTLQADKFFPMASIWDIQPSIHPPPLPPARARPTRICGPSAL
mmetsp:Transcript_16278/g.41619  ORF Transcript_16278/g.41619 Transcript_16278/m.41619 type:complete len:85 (+) Transcript_16278:405-659(+)